MTESLKAGDILMNPENKTTLWRVLEIKGNDMRVVRSGKDGSVHGLVRDKNGVWKPVASAAGFKVIGHYNARTAASNTAAKNKTAALPAAAREVRGRAPRLPAGSSDDAIYRFLETTFNSLAKGMKELQHR
jgi:hypothetical protein